MAIDAKEAINNELLMQCVNPEVAKMDIEHQTRRLEIEYNANVTIEEERSKQSVESTKQVESQERTTACQERIAELKSSRISMIMAHPRLCNELPSDQLADLLKTMTIN